jgi:CMP-N-acetylneuraminic acid synthetase
MITKKQILSLQRYSHDKRKKNSSNLFPARGGSKTIPRKNIKILAGKPLLAWTIEEAHQSKYIDRLILSSEDAEIIEVARHGDVKSPLFVLLS